MACVASILVVDDDDAIRVLLARILERDGHTVLGARHGGEAIGHLADGEFDVMVLDVMMPVANAFDVLAFMNERGRMTPTIILTAAHDKQLTDLDRNGIYAVFRKPFDLQAFRAAVRACVAEHT